ncbi:hypothetical protein HDU81_004204 [Chytriomyces hyalinus]|nr:hypothetical protein HDU81_004204 [Chytriomyces hyalinus]
MTVADVENSFNTLRINLRVTQSNSGKASATSKTRVVRAIVASIVLLISTSIALVLTVFLLKTRNSSSFTRVATVSGGIVLLIGLGRVFAVAAFAANQESRKAV